MHFLAGSGRTLLGAFALCLALPFAVLPASAADGLRLLMFRQDGCPWCARWTHDIGPVYEKTAEGRQAPLTRLDIHDPVPGGITLVRHPQFTPTFVLIDGAGKELGRIEGYPGPDFFWALLDGMLEKAAPAPPSTPPSNPSPTPSKA